MNFSPGILEYRFLLQTIKSITHAPPEEEEKFLKILQQCHLKKGDTFIHAGTIPYKIGFVVSGLFRYYYTNTKGDEFTKGFFPEGSFITAYTALISNTESYYSIQAIENATILIFDYFQWKNFYYDHRCWNNLHVALLEKGYAKKENREREFLLYNAKQRYLSFLEEYPGLEERLKQNMIASYLGITPVALSRIRGKKINLSH